MLWMSHTNALTKKNIRWTIVITKNCSIIYGNTNNGFRCMIHAFPSLIIRNHWMQMVKNVKMHLPKKYQQQMIIIATGYSKWKRNMRKIWFFLKKLCDVQTWCHRKFRRTKQQKLWWIQKSTAQYGTHTYTSVWWIEHLFCIHTFCLVATKQQQ